MKTRAASNFKNSFAMRLVAVAAFTLVTTPLFAVTIDGESRLTEEQFARKNGQSVSEVKKTFAASGTLECMSTQRKGRLIRRLTTRLTAQVTGKSDIVVTAAHGFIDIHTCEKKMRPAQCAFKTSDGRRSVTREVELVAMGDIRCDKGLKNSPADWTVLRLSAPIASIVPYDLGERKEIIVGARVWSVSAQSKDFFLDGKYAPFNKTIDDCSVRGQFGAAGAMAMLSMDCDSAPGNSGGALLARSPSGPPRLLAITVSSSVNLDGPPPRKGPRDGTYDMYKWATYAVPLVGEFRAALERATGRPVTRPESVFIGLTKGAPVIPTTGLPTGSAISPIILSPAKSPDEIRSALEKAAFPPVPHFCEDGQAPDDCRKP